MFRAKYNNLSKVQVGNRVSVGQYASAESIGTVTKVETKKAEDGTEFIMIHIDTDSHFDAYKNKLTKSNGKIVTSELYERPIQVVDQDYKRCETIEELCERLGPCEPNNEDPAPNASDWTRQTKPTIEELLSGKVAITPQNYSEELAEEAYNRGITFAVEFSDLTSMNIVHPQDVCHEKGLPLSGWPVLYIDNGEMVLESCFSLSTEDKITATKVFAREY